MNPRLNLLNREEIRHVLSEAMDLLAKVGVSIEDDELFSFLRDTGSRVDVARRRAFFNDDEIQKALKTAPSGIELFDREGSSAVRLGGDNVFFVPGSAALQVIDLGTGKPRNAVRNDLDLFADLTDMLDVYRVQSTAIVPSDVQNTIGDRVRLHHALVHCRKPVVTGTFTQDGFDVMVRMLEAVRGGKDALREKPLAIFDCCATAPLVWPALTSRVLVSCARRGIPAELISVPLVGATAPATLHGSLVQMVAENLSGLLINQRTAPGAPVIWGGCPMAFDMRHGTTLTGASETILLNGASAQVAKELNLPTHAYLALSDAKTQDPQSGFETAMGAMVAALLGINVVSGAGMLQFIGCQSFEKLIFDADVCAAALRMQSGIRMVDEDISGLLREGIERKGFLASKHTRAHFRQELQVASELIDRSPQVTKPFAERSRDRLDDLMGRARDRSPIDKGIQSDLDRILEHEFLSVR